MTTLRRTDRTTLRRRPQRGTWDGAVVDTILAEALVCHVGVAVEGRAVVLPMAFGRLGDEVILHGAAGNRVLGALRAGAEACLTFTLVDGLVLARSATHHSMNYRSLVLLGRGRPVTDPEEKRRALEAVVDHSLPGRSREVRAPSAAESDGTTVLAFAVDEGSAKVRTGPPVDDDGDTALSCWAGVVPVTPAAGRPEVAPGGTAASPALERLVLSRSGMPRWTDRRDGLELTTEMARMDLDSIHAYLAGESYWARGLRRDELVRAMQHSLCVGVFDGPRQVAFCRLVTDWVRHAWLADVFVAEGHRGRGIARWMVRFLQNRPELAAVWRWLLATRDAHGVYEERGFRPLAEPGTFMEVRRAR
jgi:nitroimidazol reductase NimA-like FMN-containing flavoprotein (pyridoxamine 5'-phosphate oxidase superfamily)/GNAT superfamily N-acetyltransferase